ncbi:MULTISPECIES: hypothetical protein [unclassified Nocardia]|uniref:hypothetical protein n=1 Tax=unclassified Nocardia TaxID=2637762 RepID=UPI001CE47C40|nr:MULTISPECIES: hypothetical protein [unclassified Nocardia]
MTVALRPAGREWTTAGSVAVRLVASNSRLAAEPGWTSAPPKQRRLAPAHCGHEVTAGAAAMAKLRSKLPQPRRQMNW